MSTTKEEMVSEKDVVAEAREVAENLIAGRPRTLLLALADEVERLRPVVQAAVEWRRVGYERKDQFSYRIGPLLDAIDIYDVGQRRPCEEM